MPNTCSDCDKIFYSDTEYEAHLLFELLRKGMATAASNNLAFATELGAFKSQMILYFIITRAEAKGISLEQEATEWRQKEKIVFEALMRGHEVKK